MGGRRLFRATLFAIFLGFGAAVPAAGVADTNEAEKFIAALTDKAISSLTDARVSRHEREARFRTLLNQHFAVRTMGRWVLGRYWKKATKGEQAEYLGLFEQLIVDTYVDRFTKYSGETLIVTGARTHGNGDIVVSTMLTRPDAGRPVAVDWRVRHRKGIYKIVDVMVEGISMGQAQRSEFSSVIRKSGGRIEGLLVELRKKVGIGA